MRERFYICIKQTVDTEWQRSYNTSKKAATITRARAEAVKGIARPNSDQNFDANNSYLHRHCVYTLFKRLSTKIDNILKMVLDFGFWIFSIQSSIRVR